MIYAAKQLLPRFPSLTMALVGGGSLLSALQSEIAIHKLTNNVRIYPSSSDTTLFMKRATVLVLPSLNEGMPNVVLEAAMCGVPSIINNFPGADEVVIDGKTGYIANSEEDMVEKIGHVLNHPALAKRMGLRAQEYVSKHFHKRRQEQFIEALLS